MLFGKKSWQLNKCWRDALFPKHALKLDSIFDIGKATNLIAGNEKEFCEDKDMLDNAG